MREKLCFSLTDGKRARPSSKGPGFSQGRLQGSFSCRPTQGGTCSAVLLKDATCCIRPTNESVQES